MTTAEINPHQNQSARSYPMKTIRLLTLHLLLILCSDAPRLLGADIAPDPSGHWEGAISLPSGALGILVDLTCHDEVWQGTIDIPMQGLRGYKLDPVKVDGPAVGFTLPGVPGNPQFAGRIAVDAISGDFTQGPGRFPFKLERRPAPAPIAGPPEKGLPGPGLVGHWLGSLKPMPGIELRIALEVTGATADKLEGFLVSLDQGAARLPISTLTERDRSVHLESKRIGGVFDGKLNDDGSELVGEWQQGGLTNPLTFKRTAQAVSLQPANRPQLPKKPYPYTEEEVVVINQAAGVSLAGTLTLPAGLGPHPAVVLITGSGPQDRDESLAGHRPFLVLADHLTRQGIAVLRCDDRGTGKSTGDFSRAIDSDFVVDALAEVAFLRTRKEIDPRRIGLVGHSEGGIVAPRAAAQSDDVAFIVLLAGVGLPMEEITLQQARDISRVLGLGEEQIAASVAVQRAIFKIARSEPDAAKAEKAIWQAYRDQAALMTDEQQKSFRNGEALLASKMKLMLSPWFRNMLAYDPRPTLGKVKCPVLALNGEKDLQVAAKENLVAIREALSAGGNTRVKTVELPGLNHLFQICQTGSPTEYAKIEETFNPGALQEISDWIREVTLP